MTECGCVYIGDCDCDLPTFYIGEMYKAIKDHKCSECSRIIEKSEEYEHVSGKWDNRVESYKTCSDCLDIRRVFFCEGWAHTAMIDSLSEHLQEMSDGIPEECIAELTPGAKQTVCKIIEEMWG